MNGFTSQCSSGVESGWTMYLDHSSLSVNPYKSGGSRFVDEAGGVFGEDYKKEAKVEEEEDLSMVSDASSGPPNFHEDEDYFDENGCFYSPSSSSALVKKSSGKKRRTDENRQRQHLSMLDDTASSPVFSFSKNVNNNQAEMENVLDFSQGFSATHYKGRSAVQKNFGFLQSSLPGKTKISKTS